MRIPCPHCGERSHAEFSYRGDATPTRPAGLGSGAPDTALVVDYVYLRDNPPGWLREHWQHTGGCRAWVVVERHVTTHEIARVSAARATPGDRGSPAR